MVRITEELVRKRAEHNEGCVSTLEEISLHQSDIEKIECLDKICRGLKILYLQSNLIPKIENLSRMKQLEYLNLALNNVERIENLEGCENLRKLDLTANFIGELTSLTSLKGNIFLEEMYLTGNPCVDYPDYRDYVISTLPQLQKLDGGEVGRRERIRACQERDAIAKRLQNSERKWKEKRNEEKDFFAKREEGKRKIEEIEEELGKRGDEETLEKFREAKEKEYQEERLPYTPESRIETHQHIKAQKEKDENKGKKKKEPKAPRNYFKDDGSAINCNEAKVEFNLFEDVDGEAFQLDVHVFKHMDTSLVDVDVQPFYVRVTLKGKILQLRLHTEVKPDSSTAKRSQVTGHLLVTMPKITDELIEKKTPKKKPIEKIKEENKSKGGFDNYGDDVKRTTAYLEVSNAETKPKVDYKNILKDQENQRNCAKDVPRWIKGEERPNSKGFVDDPDVPPLE